MKTKICLTVALLLLISASVCFGEAEKVPAAAVPGTGQSQVIKDHPEKAQKVPVAVVPEPRYEFTGALDGDDVFHDFIVRNTGTAPLRIERVRTG